jgi:hypothetical protein
MRSAARTPAERRRITILAADTGGFLGFLTYDLSLTESRPTHYRHAAAPAQDAGDFASCAYNVGQMSRVLGDQDHHGEALSLTDGAIHLAATRAHLGVRSWLHAVRAYHHACLSDPRASQTDLSAAWTLLSGLASPSCGRRKKTRRSWSPLSGSASAWASSSV